MLASRCEPAPRILDEPARVTCTFLTTWIHFDGLIDAIVSYLYMLANTLLHKNHNGGQRTSKAIPRPSKEGHSHATAPSSEKDLVPASSSSFRSQSSIPSDMGEHIGTRV